MEISAVRPDELESLLALICEVFGLPYEPAREIFYGDPYLNLENKRVLRVGGRIVSCLSIADRDVWLGNRTVRVGGIAGVATRPEDRGKGYASRLISHTLDFLKAQGYALSALVPYSSHFYRRLGYEICGNACRYITAPSFLPSSHEIQSVRPARSEDAEALMILYNFWSCLHPFHGTRDLERWNYLLKNIERCDVFVEPDGTLSGYTLSDLRQNPPAFEGEISMPTLRVLELAARSTAAQRGLIAHLATQHAAGMVEFCAPPQQLMEYGLLHLLGTGIGEEILANIEILPLLMARIIDFRAVLEAALAKIEPPVSSASWSDLRLELHDSTGKMPPESWTVFQQREGYALHRSKKEEENLPCLSGDLRVWAQVVTGFKSADDAAAQGLLYASDETAMRLGAALFPSRSPFLPTPDHF